MWWKGGCGTGIGEEIMNIGYMLFFALEVIIGSLSTLYLFVSLFVVVGQKIYRKIKYGISLYD